MTLNTVRQRRSCFAAMALSICGTLVVCALAGHSAKVCAGTITETFDSDPAARGWIGVGNTTGGDNFGYSPLTSNAGGFTGEAGGTLARTSFLHYYADTTLGGVLTLDDAVESSGKFFVGNRSNATAGQSLGFFNSASVSSGAFRIVIQEPSTSNYRIQMGLTLSNGTSLASGVQSTFSDGQYQWELDYDPNTGVAGAAVLRILDTGSNLLQTHNLSLTAAERSIGATFNAFGLLGGGNSIPGANEKFDIFIDDVTYTVPEPASLFLICFAAVGISFLTGRPAQARRRLQASIRSKEFSKGLKSWACHEFRPEQRTRAGKKLAAASRVSSS